MKNCKLLALLLAISLSLLASGCAGPAGPAGLPGAPGTGGKVMSFQNGTYPTAAYDGTIDTQINKIEQFINFGASQEIVVRGATYESISLIKFDLSPLSPHVIVDSATLTLHLTAPLAEYFPGGSILLQYMAWAEGSKEGDGIDAANWLSAEATTNWAMPGADRPDFVYLGGFYWSPNLSGSYPISLPPSIVEDWINDPSNNYGITLQIYSPSFGGALKFHSSEYAADPYLRPELTIIYYER